MKRLAALLLALGVLAPALARAHPLSFGVLLLEERTPGQVLARLTVSRGGEDARVTPLDLALDGCVLVGDWSPEIVEGASAVRRARFRCDDGPSRVRVRGLGASEQLAVRVEGLDGAATMIDGAHPEAPIPRRAAPLGAALRYGGLGVEHILLGLDHLLFVVGLMLLVADRRALLLTLTAFTVGHSLTLGLVATGLLTVPSAPVEAAIALSILFVAAEAWKARRGGPPTLATRRPWLVAGGFGLLHGLGFAGALAEVGLPREAVLPALAGFNVGVELGQVLFVAGAWLVARPFRGVAERWPTLVPHAIGVIAAFWLFGRLPALLA